jgi:hypothetical protein
VANLSDKRWKEVTTLKLVGFLTGCGLFVFLIFKSEPGFVLIVDHANLVFHEAGHPIVGIFSQCLETYGGTLGQLAFPLILAISFWLKRDATSFAGSVIWFFENWLNIARYMADARTQALPLVGGGDHDWARIFGRWHLLNSDVQIAGGVWAAGWVGMTAAVLWIVWRWWLGFRDSNVARPDLEQLLLSKPTISAPPMAPKVQIREQ